MQGALIPPLTGVAQARFVSVGRHLLGTGQWVDDTLIRHLLDRETTWAESPEGTRELRSDSHGCKNETCRPSGERS
jgi:hypothetical protein